MKRVIAMLLVLAMLFCLCACGNGGQNNANTNTDTGNTENVNVVPEPEPEPEPPKPKYYNPLSGEETEEDISSLRPVAVMLNNISYAMPQHSNSAAEILVEMNAEGNITRMLGIYQNITAETGRIGSIRSARPYYLDWALAFDSLYISVGGSNTANAQIKSRHVDHINGMGYTNIFYRDQERKAAGYAYEHTMFMTGERFVNGFAETDFRKVHEDGFDTALKFTEEAQTAGGTAASAVTVHMNSKKVTLFDYDSASKKYLISEHGDKFIDGNTGEQVSVKNVLVLHTKYRRGPDGGGTLLADMTGGKGVYICEGKMIDIEWALAEGKGLTLKKADGSPLELMRGHTFVCCPDADSGGVDAL